MRGKQARRFRRVGQKAFDAKARTTIFEYVDRLCAAPFRERLHYAWLFIRGINPHTGQKGRE